jgi:hypothetical protein
LSGVEGGTARIGSSHVRTRSPAGRRTRMTTGPRFPLPSLARAARDLRAARQLLVTTHGRGGSVLQHRDNVLTLRRALGVYIAALERDGLPVANKLRQEQMLLALTDESRRFPHAPDDGRG